MSNNNIAYLKSIVTLKCPHCNEVSMFENPSIYTWSKIGDTKRVCNHCQTNLVPETGFYFGAAYVSWGLTVALWVSLLITLKVLDALGWIEFAFLTHPKTFLYSGMVLTIILFPYLFRLSRSMWAHFFIK
jgi:hypothetical protein